VVFVNSLTPPPPPKTSALQNLIALPHRLFFFAGVVQGLLFISLLGLNYAGLISLNLSAGIYHVYALSFSVFTQFFIGFLLTTFPRYLSHPSAPKEAYLPIAWLINGGNFLLISLSFVSPYAIVLPMFLIFVGYVKFVRILLDFQRKSTVTNKSDTTWMLVAFVFGGIGQLLFMVDVFVPLYAYALGVTFYLYLFLLIMVVSQKMIPFFTANRIAGYTITKSPYFLKLLTTALVLKVLLNGLVFNALLADSALFCILLYELWRWKLPFKKSPPILWVLFLALWWTPVGFGLFVIQGSLEWMGSTLYLEKAPIHALALGYFTTVLIGFGTRIILGHSGRTPNADGYATLLFGLIQVMVIMRILAGAMGGMGYMHFILTSAGLWVLVFALWSKRYMPMLFEK